MWFGIDLFGLQRSRLRRLDTAVLLAGRLHDSLRNQPPASDSDAFMAAVQIRGVVRTSRCGFAARAGHGRITVSPHTRQSSMGKAPRGTTVDRWSGACRRTGRLEESAGKPAHTSREPVVARESEAHIRRAIPPKRKEKSRKGSRMMRPPPTTRPCFGARPTNSTALGQFDCSLQQSRWLSSPRWEDLSLSADKLSTYDRVWTKLWRASTTLRRKPWTEYAIPPARMRRAAFPWTPRIS